MHYFQMQKALYPILRIRIIFALFREIKSIKENIDKG